MKINKKILIPSIVLIVAIVATSITLALLKDKGNKVSNSFVVGDVGAEIEENIETAGVKKNVKIKNTGSAEAFVRAKVVVSWLDADGNAYRTAPVEGDDYTVTYNEEADWIQDGSTFYYAEPIAAGKSTPVLIKEIKPVASRTPEGYTFSVEILSSSMQSQPDSAVEDAWGVTVRNGVII